MASDKFDIARGVYVVQPLRVLEEKCGHDSVFGQVLGWCPSKSNGDRVDATSFQVCDAMSCVTILRVDYQKKCDISKYFRITTLRSESELCNRAFYMHYNIEKIS